MIGYILYIQIDNRSDNILKLLGMNFFIVVYVARLMCKIISDTSPNPIAFMWCLSCISSLSKNLRYYIMTWQRSGH